MTYRTHRKLSAANNVWRNEDQNTGGQVDFDGTHCPDTRRRLPQEWLIRRWSNELTRQAPVHQSIGPTSEPPDEDCYCNDPMLPLILSEKCLYPRSGKWPAPPYLVLQTPRCSSLKILPNWCSETKYEDTSHGEWWTKHATNWMYTGNVNTTGRMEILTKTSSPDHVTSTVNRTANKKTAPRAGTSVHDFCTVLQRG